MIRISHSGRLLTLLLPLALVMPQPTAASTDLEPAFTEIADSTEVQAFRDAISRVERELGAYSADLPEQLLSLGHALQRQGRHNEAVEVFKRGVHLTRINDGLYSGAQIPLIRGEIASHIAAGELTEADERQHYLYRVQIRSMDSGELRAQALMQQAGWQYNAYQLGLGEQTFSRLMNMWDLYRLALTDIADRAGETSPNLLPPLFGMLQAQYLIAGYNMDSSSSGYNSDGDYTSRQEYNRFNAYRAQSFKKGSAVIRAIYEIEQKQAETDGVAAAEALVQLGDWYLWHDERESAEATYQDALAELVGRDDAQQVIDRLFGEPVALPNLEGVRPLPARVAMEEANVVLEFGVNSRGRVIDLERVDDTEGISGKANRLMRHLRKTPFRPRFENGVPVDTEKVVRAYVIGQQ